MKIKKIKSSYRNDFTADMECEHCGHVQNLSSGYSDDFYYSRVIPAMTCQSCGKNRAGESPETKNDSGMLHVAA
jgi:hypothetical protein